ncbi:MAG: hypothetical protein ABS76_18760 [Pelagibacterium sp. SCN 64-44]|nr:MAG: hypothetical protein ABS76_18760 [Pelagibacterium sp. SCN 64-44]
MCGRFAATTPREELARLYSLLDSVITVPRYNIAPTQPVAAIWQQHGRREARFARWGLVPGWVKDPRDFPLIINARVETMAEKPAFRDALKHGRCIIPANGYYEWHTNADKSKQPYYITMNDDRPMALAGFVASWMGPNGEEIDSVATITVPANDQLSAVHDRMPAILEGEAIEAWLDVANVRAREAAQLALPLENGALKFHPVSRRVNSARDDDPGLIVEVTPEKPAPPPPKSGQMSLF